MISTPVKPIMTASQRGAGDVLAQNDNRQDQADDRQGEMQGHGFCQGKHCDSEKPGGYADKGAQAAHSIEPAKRVRPERIRRLPPDP